MSAAKKKAASAPDMGGLTDDWERLAAMREAEHGQEEQEPVAEVKAPAKKTTAASVSEPAMARRSWYASADAVSELARVVDDIHHATRAPKHEVVSELFRAAVAAGPRVEKKLSKK